jgi:uncharacterized protein
MKIRLASLQNGFNRWLETIEPSELELSPGHFDSSLEVGLTAEITGGRVTLQITVTTPGHFECDRCGNFFRQSIAGACSVMFIKRDEALPDEMPGDDLRTFLPGQDELDITVDVRDAMLLAMPMRLLCREECRGLCPRCGVNLNTESCNCQVNAAP